MQKTDEMDLKTILDHIETAVKKHNEFKADMKIPIGFFPDEKLGMKVPYPDNKKAVDSVKVIIRLLRSAIGSKGARMQLLAFKKILSLDFKLNLPDFKQERLTPLTVAKFTACQELVRAAIARHNDNIWVKDSGFEIPEIPDDGDYYEPPPTQERRLYGPQIPKNFFLPSTFKKNIHLSIPREDDNNGKRSVNDILELMAL
ncbi:hypothetical protein H0H93_016427, partial [Arthromyces matolae]